MISRINVWQEHAIQQNTGNSSNAKYGRGTFLYPRRSLLCCWEVKLIKRYVPVVEASDEEVVTLVAAAALA